MASNMGRHAFIKGVALLSPFSIILLAMLLFGGSATRFFLELFSGYDVHQNGPYTILVKESDANPKEAAETLDTFVNQMVLHYQNQLEISRPDKVTTGLKIYLLSSPDDLEKFGLQRMNRDLAHNGGYFLPAKREIALVLTGQKETDDRGLRHEMMHALMYLSKPDAIWPNWFAEGMASFFEHSTLDETGWHPGGLPGTRPPTEKPIPLKNLLEAGGKEFTSGDNHLFYRSASMLVEFLFSTRRRKLFDYYRRIRNGKEDGAFTEIFGDRSTLETAWRTFLKKRK